MSSSYSLLCYTRVPTSRQEANNADIALSMHLALRSQISGEWIPLNGNYGIFFAAGVPGAAVDAASRKACTAAARFTADPYDDGRAGSDALAYGAVMPGVDIALKSLKDPYLFRLRDGRFAVAATRTDRGGAPDGSERSSLLLVVSPDLTSYDQRGLIRFDTTSGVHRPTVEYDGPAQRYVIRWVDDEGQAMRSFAEDIVAAVGSVLPIEPDGTVPDGAISADGFGAGASGPGGPSDPAESCVGVPDAEVSDGGMSDGDAAREARMRAIRGIDGAIAGNVIAVSNSEAKALVARFGRVYNTGVSSRGVTIPASLRGCEARDQVGSFGRSTAILRYSDGSMAVRAVDWDADQLSALADDAAEGRLAAGDRRRIDGRVRQSVYPVPFAVERADPSVFSWNFNGEAMFMFIATDDSEGNCVDPNGGRTHMPLRVASTIEGLSDAAGGRDREIDLLVCGDLNGEGRAMTGCFWAPELHMIGGRLSVLFMPCFDGDRRNPDGTRNDRAGKPDMWTGSCHIMQLRQDGEGRDLDPREASNWTVPEPILRSDGGILNPVQRISLDMTVITDSGRWYYAWQQVGSIWIAPFDPRHPARLTGEPSQIIVPEFAWDNMIAEGPNAFVHDGRIYLIYSGSAVGIDYTTGLATAPAGQSADLSDPDIWTKLDYPLQKSGLYNGQWQLGTGHGMWSRDEDGNLIYVFHNAEYVNGRYGGRDAQVRRVHWSAGKMPILDMQTTEELNPAYAGITMEIVVR